MRERIRRTLTESGIRVVAEARTLAEARNIVGAVAVDVIVLDLFLPDGSALTWLENLADRRNACPVVVLTSESQEVYRWRCTDLGASAYLDKALEFDRLIGAIHCAHWQHQDGERTLATGRALIRAHMEAAPEAMVLVETDGRIIEGNSRLADLTRWGRASLEGRDISVIFPAHSHGRLRRELAREPGGDTRVYRHALLRCDGTRVQVDTSVRRLPDGRTLAILREHTAVVEHEARIRQAEKLRTIGELTAGVAHDFRNLLTIVQSNAELLLEDPDTDAQRRVLDIRDAAQRANAMIRRLLAFARTTALHLRRTEVPTLLAELRRYLAHLLPPAIQVTVTTAPDLAPIRADGTSVEQALLNLATNARDAMPTGGALRIEARAVTLAPAEAQRLETHSGDFVRLSVIDDGIGMDDATQRRIFEPFFTTKATDQGTGLGLSSVLGIMRQHRGGIDIESREGGGTKVHLYFPVLDTGSP